MCIRDRNERSQVRRKDRDDREHHPLRAIAALAEGLADLEALDDLLALGLAGGGAHLLAEGLAQRVDVHLLEHLEDGLAAHAGGELVVAVLLGELHVDVYKRQRRASPSS